MESSPPLDPTGHADELHWQRLNRELLELMNEIRITLPAVMVLFSFMLILPFSNRFKELGGIEEAAYYLTFISTAVAAVLLIAPSIHHRIRFRQGDKDRLLLVANNLTIAGTMLLSVAIGGAVFLVSDMLFGITIAAIVAVSGLALVVLVWFVIPASWPDRGGRSPK